MLRIQLLSSGEFLEGITNSLVIEQATTLFNDPEKLVGSYSYPFNFGWTENNKRNLQHAQSMTAANRLRSVEVMIWLNNNAWKKALLQFETTEKEADGNLVIDNSTVSEALKTRKLTELYWPDSDLHVYSGLSEYLTHMLATVHAEPGVHPYVFFPLKNERFLGEKLYLDNTALYEDVTLTDPVYLNAWWIDANGNGAFKADFGNHGYAETPFFYLSWVIKQVCSMVGYTLDGSFTSNEHVKRLVIYSNRQRGGGYSFGNPGPYLPEITFADFFKALRDEYSLYISFNPLTQVCRLESFTSLTDESTPIDLRFNHEAGTGQLSGYRSTGEPITGYTLTRKPDETDALWKKDENSTEEDQSVLVLGDGSKKREIRIGTTRMITENAPHYESQQVNWRIPLVSQIGQSAFPGYESSDFTRAKPKVLRLLYWHGLQPDQEGNLYPYGSADNLDFEDQPLTSFSLSPNGYSMTEVSMIRWYKFMAAAKPVEISLLLDAQKFMELEGHRKVIIQCDRGSVVNCLIDKITAQVNSRSQLVKAMASLYIYLPDNEPEAFLGLPSGEVPPPPYDNGTVYLRLSVRNSRPKTETYPGMQVSGYIVDVYVELFADAAATIPKEVTNLLVKYLINTDADPVENSNETQSQQYVSGAEKMLIQDIYNDYSESEEAVLGGGYAITYSYTRLFTAIDTADYVLI